MKKTILALSLAALSVSSAFAEVNEVVIGHQFGWAYSPIYVMKEKQLIEKHAKAAGLNDLKVSIRQMGTPAMIRDGMLAGQVHFGSVGVPTLITLGDKTKGEYKALGSIVSLPMYLNTTEDVKSLCDLKGKIAVPTIKTSVQAIALQALTHKQCGSYTALDSQTVSMTHPDGMASLFAGQIGSHLTSPPFQGEELKNPKVKKLASSYDVFGKSTFILFVASEKFKAENPKTFAAVNAAFQEAQGFVDKNRPESLVVYAKSEKPKSDVNEMLKDMASGEVSFTATPQGVGKYLDIMKATGAVKNQALTVQNLLFPEAPKGGN